eukprot:2355478-Prymnesium_polylepis.1
MQALVRARLQAGDGARVLNAYVGKLPTAKGPKGESPPQTVYLEGGERRVRATAVFATNGSYGSTEKDGIHG